MLEFIKKHKKAISRVIVLVLFLIWLPNFLAKSDELKKADAVIAISGGDTVARTTQAIDLYQDGWAPKLIFSGDALDPLSPSNADVMKKIATQNNVPSQDIYIEENSDNTQQNAINSQNIIESRGYKSIILVTSSYHQRRAYLEFKDKLSKDITIINQPVEEESWQKNNWFLSLRGWYLTISETIKIPITIVKNFVN